MVTSLSLGAVSQAACPASARESRWHEVQPVALDFDSVRSELADTQVTLAREDSVSTKTLAADSPWVQVLVSLCRVDLGRLLSFSLFLHLSNGHKSVGLLCRLN